MEKKRNKKLIISIISIILIFIVSFFVYEKLTWNKEYYKSEKNINIPIFLYHDIVENESEIKQDYMQTSKKVFEDQISGILKLGYKVINYDDLIAYNKGEKKLPKHICLIDFDDGYLGNYTVATDIIKKYNIPVTIFVVDNLVGTEGYMSWNQIRELESTGLVDINSHGKEHAKFNELDSNKAVEDVKYAHSRIEEELDKEVKKVFTYPYGLNNEEIVNKLADEGFVQNFTDNKINSSKNLNMSKLHRCYPLKDSVAKIFIKMHYRIIRYGTK